MIVNFADRHTERFFNGERVSKFVAFERVAMRKLQQLHAATDLNFLRIPPNNRLEALQGDRQGQYSIRINDQFRLVFEWKNNQAHNVEIIDYH